MYYWAREFSSALPAGQGYSVLPRTIIISIVDFNLFDCAEYSSFFQPLEVTRHMLLSDKMGFHFFELKKLPNDITENDSLLLWLSLFKAETVEELDRIRDLEVPEMEQAINAYYRITASSEFREKERLREKAMHDEAQALYHAKQEGKIEGRMEGKVETAKNLLKMGMPLEQIAQATELSVKDLESYK